MRAARRDLAVLEHDDLVGQRDRRQPVRDHERRAPLHHLGERVLDAVLGGGVHARGGVVEDQDARLGEQRPRDRHPLALAAAEREPALADQRVEPLGQLVEQLAEPGAHGGLPHLVLGRVRPRVGDVLAERRREQERVVRHHRHLAAQRRRARASRTSTPSTSTEPCSTSYSRGISITSVVLPEPVGPTSATVRPGLHVEVDVPQHRLAAVVAEGHVAQLHAPAAGRERPRVGRGHQPRGPVEQLEHARAARHGPLRHPERHAEPAHRADEHQHVAVERDELADGDPPVDHLPAAHEQQRRQAELGKEADERRVEGAQPRGHHRLVEHARRPPC